jgi:glycosyltransferase involved in cell wall biosynthesis
MTAIDPPAFSLVLGTVGRTEPLAPLFDSLAAQTDRDFELVVVDQNGDDRLAPYLSRARDAGLAVVHLNVERRGLAFARNAGLDVARGRFVAFPDDDCWYEPDVIASVRAAIAADGGLHGVVARWVEEDPQALRPAQMLSFSSWHRMRGGDASSICLFLDRALVDRLGRFDVRLGVGCWYGAGEETDLVIRALAGNTRIAFRPEVRVHHRLPAPAPALDARVLEESRRRARGTGALYRKHRMSSWVVLRGLASPLVKGAFSRRPHVALAQGAYVSMGRLEGLMRWRREES